jgi:hypothetical protein
MNAADSYAFPHATAIQADYYTGSSGADGARTFSFGILATGRYDISVVAYGAGGMSDKLGGIATDIDVVSGQTRVIEIRLTRRPLVRIQLLTADGEPARNYNVRVTPMTSLDRNIHNLVPWTDTRSTSTGVADGYGFGITPHAVLVYAPGDSMGERPIAILRDVVLAANTSPAATVTITLPR